MKNLILGIASLILTGIPLLSSAQNETDFEKFLDQTFEVNLSNLDHGNNNAPFLSAFGENLVWIDVNVSIDGKVAEEKRTKQDLRTALKRIALQQNLVLKWEIEKYNELSARENTLIASFEVNVTMLANDKVISSGKNLVEIIGQNNNGSFAITYMSVLQIADKLYVGPCYVNITKSSPNTYTTITAYPDGTDYELIEKIITFSEDNKMKVVKIENLEQKYYWNTTLNILSLKMDGGIKIGSASDPKGVILIILKNETGKKCTKMILSSNPKN